MKKKIAVLLIGLVFASIGWLTWKSLSKLRADEARNETVSSIPHLTIEKNDGRLYVLEDLKKPLLLILFNSECEFCQHEAKVIFENAAAFKKTQIVFVSDEPMEKITGFATQYFPDDSNAIFARAASENIINIFGTVTYPNLFIYDAEGILIKEFKGEIQIESILTSLGSE